MKKQKQIKSNWMFCICAAVTTAVCGLGLVSVNPVFASENIGEEIVTSNDVPDTGEDEKLGVYDFKDNKTTGTVTVTKVWDDDKTNEEREIPDIKISTVKPSKSTLGYTVTFHGDKAAGLVFDDGSDINEVVYNSSGQIVDGVFEVPVGWTSDAVSWFTDKALTTKVDVSEDGTVQMPLSGDIDLWGKVKTFEIKVGYEFNRLIPNTVTEIFFTDEIKPESASVIDVDADGDGEVIAWMEENGTVMKVSTQIKDVKVQAAKNSERMFYQKSKIQTIDFTNLDTAKVTDMNRMFDGCSGLSSLDLSSFDTAKVTDMESMFESCEILTTLDLSSFDTQNVTNMSTMFSICRGLTALDLSSFNTQNVTDMSFMLNYCSGLTTLDLSSLNTQNVTSMNSMFRYCSGLTALDLSSFNTQKVTDMGDMFESCKILTALDLSSFDTQNVTDMGGMFKSCSGLTALDLSPLDTQKVTDMGYMFYDCSGLTALDLSPLDTQKVTDMGYMFYDCSGLTALDLSPLDTQKVTNMSSMFYNCSGLTALDLSSFNTQKVTDMSRMFQGCSGLTTFTTGVNFKFGRWNYLLGTWRNTAGETFTSGTFPSNVADTYTKISN